ncbi:cytochrome c peroxidase [Pedobacter sp. UYEF25]
MKKRAFWFTMAILVLMVYACKKQGQMEDAISSFLGFQKPANFPEPVYKMANNKITEGGFILGRNLFYESRLSRNNTVSCGSCHIQSSGFTQHGHDVSHGIDDRLGTRNAPPIMNLAWNEAFLWGGGIYDLDLQPVVPITSHEEMDENLENVLAKIRSLPKYQTLFKAAFGTEEVNTARFMKALSQFMLMCVSSNSKYDKVMRKEDNQVFTSTELAGYAMFKANCASCHAEPLFTDGKFRNNGLAPNLVNDQGLYSATLTETDRYKFKVPSLRNLSYTAPYMHDGRFLTIEGVLDHYTGEVKATANLDPLLKKDGKLGIALTAEQKLQLISFLKTLDDRDFVNRKDLSEQ